VIEKTVRVQYFASEVELALVLGGRVRVTVRNVSGAIVAPARLELLSASGERVPGVFVHRRDDDSWTTRIEAAPALRGTPVPPGRYVVVATNFAGDIVQKEVEVVRGDTRDLELTLNRK
jgi:hypothetical protein